MKIDTFIITYFDIFTVVFSVKRTTKVMTKARTNFEKAQYKDKENIRTIDVDVDDIESSVDLYH